MTKVEELIESMEGELEALDRLLGLLRGFEDVELERLLARFVELEEAHRRTADAVHCELERRRSEASPVGRRRH